MDEREFLGDEPRPKGILSAGVTDVGGPLTEEEFFKAMRDAYRFFGLRWDGPAAEPDPGQPG